MYNPSEVHKLSDANVLTLATFSRLLSEALLYGAEMFGSIALVLDEHVKFQRSLKQHGQVLQISEVCKELARIDEQLAKQLERAEVVKFSLGKLWIKQSNDSMSGVQLWLMKEKIVEACETAYKCRFKVRFIRN